MLVLCARHQREMMYTFSYIFNILHMTTYEKHVIISILQMRKLRHRVVIMD